MAADGGKLPFGNVGSSTFEELFMIYAEVDPAITAWVRQHGLKLWTEWADAEARFCYVSGGQQECFQVSVKHPHAGADGGQNPHINGDKPKAGTEFAVAPPGPRGWTAGRLSTPSAAEGGGRRPAFTWGQPSRHNRPPGVGARLPDGIPRRHRGLPVTKFRHLCAGFHRR